MAWMSDEAYDLKLENRDKKVTAQSARNRRGHTGKGGGMKTASDYMSKKELDALNGECKTYHLGRAMDWTTYIEMPSDLKKMYIKKLRAKFNVPDENLAEAMGVDFDIFVDHLKSIGLRPSGDTKWSIEEWERFVNFWIIIKEEK